MSWEIQIKFIDGLIDAMFPKKKNDNSLQHFGCKLWRVMSN